MRATFVFCLLIAAAFAACVINSQVTIPGSATVSILSCQYLGAQQQTRCVNGNQPTFMLVNGKETRMFTAGAFDQFGTDLTKPSGWGTLCAGGCSGQGFQFCYPILSNNYTVDFKFTCMSANCVMNVDFSMDTWCGNGICDPGESCGLCVQDCCPTTTNTMTGTRTATPSSSLGAVASPSRTPSRTPTRSPSGQIIGSPAPSTDAVVTSGNSNKSSAMCVAYMFLLLVVCGMAAM